MILGNVARVRGDYEQAKELYDEAVESCRRAGTRGLWGSSHSQRRACVSSPMPQRDAAARCNGRIWDQHEWSERRCGSRPRRGATVQGQRDHLRGHCGRPDRKRDGDYELSFGDSGQRRGYADPADDHGIGILSGNNNLVEANTAIGNTNGIILFPQSTNTLVRLNNVVGNPPLQVSVSLPTSTGFDILNLSAPGTSTFDRNLCITAVGAPCPGSFRHRQYPGNLRIDRVRAESGRALPYFRFTSISTIASEPALKFEFARHTECSDSSNPSFMRCTARQTPLRQPTHVETCRRAMAEISI